jgi:hypothetical protein
LTDVRLRSLTSHHINIVSNTERITLPPAAGPVPRITEHVTPAGTINHKGAEIPVVHIEPSATADLPPPQSDTLLIVPRLIADAHPHRTDLLIPYDPIRDTQGRITGCRSLARLTPTKTTDHRTAGDQE